MTMSELHALEMRGTQRDDKVKMQLTMHMSKIETRMQKLGEPVVIAYQPTPIDSRLTYSFRVLNPLYLNLVETYV